MSTNGSNNRPSGRPSVAGKRTARGSRSSSRYARDSYVGRRSTDSHHSAYHDHHAPHAQSAQAPASDFPGVSGRMDTHRLHDDRYDTGRFDSRGYAGRSSSKASGRRPSARSARASERGGYEPLFGGSADGIGRSIRRRRSIVHAAIGVAVVAVLIGGIGFFVSNAPIDVSVNGASVKVSGAKTVQAAFEAAGEPAKAGNLVDVEGNTLEEGKGYRFSFAVNGQPGTDPSSKLADGDALVFSDGGNIEEDADVTETSIPYESTDQGYGPIHAVVNPGAEGVSTTKTGKISGKTVTQTTSEPQDRLYRRYYPDTNGEKVVALTFDDGPWDTSTAEILDILKENDAKATFFTVGNRIDGDGVDLVKREVAEGHQVCTHTWDHAGGSGQGVNLSFMSRDEQRDEITKGMKAIADATGQDASKVIRAPGGNFPTEVWENVDDLITADIGWDIDTEDWRRPGVNCIAERIKSATPGDIILMHDGGGDRSQTVSALKEALPYLKEQGFRFITIDEMMQYPMKDL